MYICKRDSLIVQCDGRGGPFSRDQRTERMIRIELIEKKLLLAQGLTFRDAEVIMHISYFWRLFIMPTTTAKVLLHEVSCANR